MTLSLPLEQWKKIEELVNLGLEVDLLASRFVVVLTADTPEPLRQAARDVAANWIAPPELDVDNKTILVPAELANLDLAVISSSARGFEVRRLSRKDQALITAILDPEVPAEVTLRQSGDTSGTFKDLKSFTRRNLVVRVKKDKS
ncbi:hypothetical protein [Deinococcus knuensis]|uniref:Uncharacterized protein n=1 Tax=Deinococcus knuensis TaxID=1837380 RepID=A0ABQ2SZ93_9DEIO|nr:hypothetical protein [Deinococcus knuensis]GGS44575.1 hypothetical protein GCM10008961_39200 [Deinococcus knuensis]